MHSKNYCHAWQNTDNKSHPNIIQTKRGKHKKMLFLSVYLAGAFQCIIKILNDEWEMVVNKHYQMYVRDKYRERRY